MYKGTTVTTVTTFYLNLWHRTFKFSITVPYSIDARSNIGILVILGPK